MFLQLQPDDTRPGNWLCCPVQKRNRRERSSGMVSSDREYSATHTERLADVFVYVMQKMKVKWRIFFYFQWRIARWTLNSMRTFIPRDKWEHKLLPGWLVLPNPQISIKTQSHTVLICNDFFSICWGSGFNTGSRPFPYRSIWEMAG